MFIELVESLRCIAPHEDSWLVAATRRMSGRSIVDGTLGCPVCRRSYAIAGGVAYFGVAADDQSAGANDASDSPPAPAEGEAVRLAALLGLTSSGGIVVLAGAWALHADALAAIAPGVRLLLLDPPAATRGNDDDAASRDGTVSIVRAASDALPLAAGAARAVAF
ncbi:MAG TPA: hypothetical protein VFJ74_16210, partial [Gemmatimonadaceae bacterium]|nr:hypothetical protein [Gemmatimonadaceae bacterium]